MNRRRFSTALSAAALAAALPARGHAQSSPATPDSRPWPERPIRLIVPFPPGGGTDTISRQLAERMAAHAGWTIVVENRAGAGGNIGLDAVAKAPPDGHTIGMGQASNLAVNPALYVHMPFDPLKDLAPVAPVASQGLIAVVSAQSQLASLAGLVAAARRQPEAVSLAHAGSGTIGHLAGEMLARQAGVRMLIVPYKGIAPAVTELLGGQVDVLFGNPLAVMPLITAGQLRPIAVSSARRLAALPAVPTVAEQGFPGFDAVNWSGLVAPARTPDAVIARLNAEAIAAQQQPEMLQRLALDGSEPFPGTPADFAAFVRSETAKWGAVVREIGLRVE
jgi:tripartite-type tricarboxylate transporter receptor subunit TctC